jgi:hypothetical protein
VANIRANDLSADRGLSWLAGDAIWTVFDYQSWSRGPYTGSGDLDLFRIPKFSGQFMRSQRDPSVTVQGVNCGPMVFIASYWNSSSSTTVSVYSNCDQVRLYKNGSLVSTNNPVTGTNLEHPRFSFNVSPFASGNLRAEGLISGTARAWDTVYTPGSASRVRVIIDTAGLRFAADGSDIAIVYGEVLDANGQVIPTAGNSVTFSVNGNGTLVGTNPVAAIAGIASILLRAGTAGGQIVVTGSATGTSSGSDTVISHEPPTTAVFEPAALSGAAAPLVPFSIYRKGSMLSVRLPCGADNAGASIFTLCNAQGRVVGRWSLTKSTTRIDIAPLPHGVYFGQITAGACRYLRKIAR